jgi:hypothetical protein
MKFKHYNELNSKTRLSNGRPYISISTKSGVIRFDTSAISALKLKEGVKVEFLQSEVDGKDWYIRVNSPEGFSLRRSPNSSALQIQCIFLAKSINKSMSSQAMSSSYLSVRIQVAAEMDPDANAYAMLTTQARTQV